VEETPGGRLLYKFLEYPLPDGSVVELIAIPKNDGKTVADGKGIDSFYIMKDKVSAGQFAHFKRDFPGAIAALTGQATAARFDWRSELAGENPRYPALGVRGIDAYCFATLWMNGALPTDRQWQKAAGFYREDKGAGPYKGMWDPASRDGI